MARIRVATVIEAPPDRVWAAIEDVGTHTEWMADAVAIRFRGDQRRGVGTVFECDTKVGPIRLTDAMEITEWAPGRALGVRHVGVVTGEGRFTLGPRGRGRTRFGWEERIRFPWWLGGPLGAVVGGRALRRVWKGNLRTLAALVERR